MAYRMANFIFLKTYSIPINIYQARFKMHARTCRFPEVVHSVHSPIITHLSNYTNQKHIIYS